jgi:hypothetical protein
VAAKPGSFLARVMGNIVLRTTLYYVGLFGVAALFWRLPR